MRYEYHCHYCKLTREVYHSIKSDYLVRCKICNKIMQRGVGGGCGFILKGEGFFRNDYKKPQEVKEDYGY